jgi:hypothetical protein
MHEALRLRATLIVAEEWVFPNFIWHIAYRDEIFSIWTIGSRREKRRLDKDSQRIVNTVFFKNMSLRDVPTPPSTNPPNKFLT